MRVPRVASVLSCGLVACLLASACTDVIATETDAGVVAVDIDSVPLVSTSVPAPTTTVPAATTPATTNAPPSTTTTTLAPLDVADPACVVRVVPGDTLGTIAAARADEIVTNASIQAENALPDEAIAPDQLLDVCIDNGIDDITGAQRLERNAAVVASETFVSVTAQQAKLNELLVPYEYPEMPVDGVSGPVTRRALCAARLALGLPVTRADMAPGSVEEQFLLATAALPMPPNVATDGRWIFIDLTCQVLLAGEGTDRLVFVFPTSTGEAGYETRLQERRPASRFNPALQNGGWHNSSSYPVAEDNPLNGNMYKPLYFDRGQAIHGANNVPTSPQSKGCARLRPANQDALIGWLGLGDVTGSVGRDRIGATVTVRGSYDLG